MKINVVTVILLLCFLFPLLKGFLLKFSSYDAKETVVKFLHDIFFIVSLYFGMVISKKIMIEHSSGVYSSIYNAIPANIKLFFEEKPIFIFIIAFPILAFIVYNLICLVLDFIIRCVIFPIIDHMGFFLNRGNGLASRTVRSVFSIPRALCYIVIVAFLFNIFSVYNKNAKLNSYLKSSKLYNSICTKVIIPAENSEAAKRLPTILDNSLKIVIKNTNGDSGQTFNNKNQVTYYNGITIDEGVKSNSEIDNFARKLVSGVKDDRQKAKILYDWVGQNISYDDNKANEVLNNDYSVQSGAINTFNTRKGICFDYSCLYAAMCRADGIKVRVITGKGFNGINWVGHAWNQAYLSSEGKWINVDTTFYKGGNYFDSSRFYFDHRETNIAGEW